MEREFHQIATEQHHEADLAKVQEWLGHANIATTRLNDRRKDQAGGQPDV